MAVIEFALPDITPYRTGNIGIPYVTRWAANAPGPHVLINALAHGNEPCGAHALQFLFDHQIRPKRGTLTLCYANVAAYQRFDPTEPFASRYVDEDFNRLWDAEALDGPGQSCEIIRARQLRPIVDQSDYLLDLHSMQHATAPLILSGAAEKGKLLAQRMGVPATVVVDAGHAAGRRLRDYGEFTNDSSPKTALLVECGQHWAQSSANLAIDCTLRFLAIFDLLEPEWAERVAPTTPVPQRIVEVTEAVTVTSDRFHFTDPFLGLEIIPSAGTVIGQDGDRPIRTPYDDCILIMPSRRLVPGQTAVRLGRFVA